MAQLEGNSRPGAEGTPEALGEKLLRLVSVVERLRSADGCPWDRQQTPQSLLPYLLEETYEVMESVTADDAAALEEELGDLLLHIVFQGCLAQEAGRFTLGDSLNTVTRKLTRPHPHVFGDQRVADTADVRRRWEAAKQREKGRASLPRRCAAHAAGAQSRPPGAGKRRPLWDLIGRTWLACGQRSWKRYRN